MGSAYLAAYRRFVLRPPRLERNREAVLVLSLIGTALSLVLPYLTKALIDRRHVIEHPIGLRHTVL